VKEHFICPKLIPTRVVKFQLHVFGVIPESTTLRMLFVLADEFMSLCLLVTTELFA
jgi:hypothetical protein